jgi:sialate O-acetylesterase
MQFPVDDVNDANAEIAAADFPQIRLLIVPCKAFDEPQSNCGGKWAVCSPQTIRRFSAVGYFFGRELHKTLGVPVGLVDSSWGGTTAEAWTSRAVLQGDDDLAKLFTNYQEIVANWDPNKAQAEYERKMAVWKVEVEKAKAEGTKFPRDPYKPFSPAMAPGPAKLYNGMVAPVIPLAIRGAIWYQGESNADRPDQYARLLPAMIRNWRADWGQGDFSFYIVQLANYREIKEKPSDSEWPRLREAQLKTMQTVPNTGMAVIIDVGAADDIHPKDKQTVGQRLALWAMAKDYGKDVVFSGPVFKSMEKQDGKCVLSFDYADGLTAKGGEELKGFAIAGEGKKFIWAEAKIEGDKVVVWSEQVPDPVAVRYAWANNPVCNLYNAADLPACPFRTDDWPMPVKEKKPKKTDSQPATQSATQPATQPASN